MQQTESWEHNLLPADAQTILKNATKPGPFDDGVDDFLKRQTRVRKAIENVQKNYPQFFWNPSDNPEKFR